MDGIELIIMIKLDMYHKNMYQIQNYQKQQPEVDMTEQLLFQKKIQSLIKKQ